MAGYSKRRFVSKMGVVAAASALVLSLGATAAYADEAGSISVYGPSVIDYSGESSYFDLHSYLEDNEAWEEADWDAKNAPARYTVESSNPNVAKVAVEADRYDRNGGAVLRITPVAKGTTTVKVVYNFNGATVTDTFEYTINMGEWKWESDGWHYVYSDGTQAADEGVVIDGETYFFDANGRMLLGWYNAAEDGDKPWWFYLTNYGALTGWQWIGNAWYYLDEDNGAMYAARTYRDNDGYSYYLDASGAMQTGWANRNVDWNYTEKQYTNYTTSTDPDGTTSRSYTEPDWLYLTGNGTAAVGWNWIGNAWYYLGTWADPSLRTGTAFWDQTGKHYVVDHNGAMRTGWYNNNVDWDFKNGVYNDLDSNGDKNDDAWYYAYGDGELAYGWQWINGAWYHLGTYTYPKMDSGWYRVDGEWYYSNESGAMVANGWVGDYYLTASGAMATNAWIGQYHVNASGVWDRTA